MCSREDDPSTIRDYFLPDYVGQIVHVQNTDLTPIRCRVALVTQIDHGREWWYYHLFTPNYERVVPGVWRADDTPHRSVWHRIGDCDA